MQADYHARYVLVMAVLNEAREVHRLAKGRKIPIGIHYDDKISYEENESHKGKVGKKYVQV